MNSLSTLFRRFAVFPARNSGTCFSASAFPDPKYARWLLGGMAAVIIAYGSGALLVHLSNVLPMTGRPLFIASTGFFVLSVLALILILGLGLFRRFGCFRIPAAGIILFQFILLAVHLGSTAFSVDDEIYSWNLWAVQHFQGQEPDYYYTRAPYPQGLSLWLASVYRALGQIDGQSVPRLTLAATGLVYLLAISSYWEIRNTLHGLLAAVVVLLVWQWVGVGAIFQFGLADPLMSGALLASVSLFIAYGKNPTDIRLLVFSAGCAVVAAYSKQPALIWGLAALPLLTLWGVLRLQWPGRTLLIAGITILFCIYWPLGPGSGFTDNGGVISKSMSSRSIPEQLAYSARRYLFGNPAFLVLLVASFWSSWRIPLLRALWLVLLLPSLLAWFIWGAYNLRLGIHAVGLAGLLFLSGIMTLGLDSEGCGRWVRNRLGATGEIPAGVPLLLSLLLAVGVFTAIEKGVFRQARKPGVYLTDGARQTLYEAFGEDHVYVERNLYSESARIWTTSNYVYGLFYGHATVGRPAHRGPDYDEGMLWRDLRSFDAEYAVFSGRVAYGPSSGILKQVADRCPEVFRAVAGPPNPYGYIVYKVHKESLREPQC